MNERVLIVNADDFGMTEAGDEAILGLFQAGRITSSTILAPGPARTQDPGPAQKS